MGHVLIRISFSVVKVEMFLCGFALNYFWYKYWRNIFLRLCPLQQLTMIVLSVFLFSIVAWKHADINLILPLHLNKSLFGSNWAFLVNRKIGCILVSQKIGDRKLNYMNQAKWIGHKAFIFLEPRHKNVCHVKCGKNILNQHKN